MATSGDRRDAFQAGKSPASILTVSERSQTRIRSFGRKTGAIYSPPPDAPEAANRYARPIPADIPTVAPIRPINTASLKNIDRINHGFAPIAFIVPISFVLSFTDVQRVVTTPIALTSIAMNPTSNVNELRKEWTIRKEKMVVASIVERSTN
jgi:hypothetical protein